MTNKPETPNQDALKKSTFDELRQSTFTLMIVSVSMGAALLIWLGNVQVRTSPPLVVALWCILEAVCALSWWVHRRNLRLAIHVAISGFWLCNAVAVLLFGQGIFAYIFALITLLTGVVISRLYGLTISTISSAFLIAIQGAVTDSLFPVLMIWFTLIASFVVFRSLYEALDMAWSYQDYAVKQMSEAREHRAKLMQLTKALNEVRQDLERTNTQLVHVHRAAEEARRLKAQFAANVSHELRTPINLIVGFSETIVLSPEAYGVSMPPVYWTDMNTIYRSARHLQSLINDVLDVSQIEAGKMAIFKEEIDSGQVVAEAANLARDLIESRGLMFNVVLPPSMPVMYLDRTRIRQVILNLLSNAARFTNSGTITLAACLDGSQLRISVTDTGIGIPPSDLNRVFEEFHQVEGSLSRRRGGSGLGLTLSKQFVELHGGRIWAESEGVPGQGSTITFTLPLMDRNVGLRPIPVTPEPAAESDKNNARYFVVYDDDEAILQLFARHTSKHKAVEVTSEDEAIRVVERIHPAALVIDERNDHERIANRLQARGDATPLIACAMPSTRRALQLSAAVFPLSKPVTGEGLRAALQRFDMPHTILLIGEDRDVIRMLSRPLQAIKPPLTLLKAYSAEEGLALAGQQHPGLIILDDVRSKSGDTSILMQLQADPLLKAIPILLVSAGNGDELTPAREGQILVRRTEGFQPIELVRCIEALVDAFTPANAPEFPETRSDSAAS